MALTSPHLTKLMFCLHLLHNKLILELRAEQNAVRNLESKWEEDEG